MEYIIKFVDDDSILDFNLLSKNFKIMYKNNLYVETYIGIFELFSIKCNNYTKFVDLIEDIKKMEMEMKITIRRSEKIHTYQDCYFLEILITDDKDTYAYITRNKNIYCIYMIIEYYKNNIKIPKNTFMFFDIDDETYTYNVPLRYSKIYTNFIFKKSFKSLNDFFIVKFNDGIYIIDLTYSDSLLAKLPIYKDYITFFNENHIDGECMIWKHDNRYSYKYLHNLVDKILHPHHDKYNKDRNDELYIEFCDFVGYE